MFYKKLTALGLASLLTLTTTACGGITINIGGNQKQSATSENQQQSKDTQKHNTKEKNTDQNSATDASSSTKTQKNTSKTSKTIDFSSSKGDLTITQKTTGTILHDYGFDEAGDDYVKYLPKRILRLARNEIFASHGYIFSSSDLKNFFSKKTWYKPSIKADKWSDKLLSKTEREHVKTILKYENDKTVYTALDLSSNGKGTTATNGRFTITLPSVWKDNYVITKSTNKDGSSDYYFYSKNNLIYGYGGVVFTIRESKEKYTKEDYEACPEISDLGKGNGYYYYLISTTEANFSELDALSKEYQSLASSLDEIKSSFKA